MAVKFLKESDKFKRTFGKLDIEMQRRVEKLIQKIIISPEIGKPMMYERKGTREVYLKPLRFSYSYSVEEDKITLLNLYHKRMQ